MSPARALAAIVAAAALTVGGATGAAPATATVSQKWLTLAGFWPSGTGPLVVGSASGRGWIGFSKGEGDSRSTILGSLRQAGGRASFAKAVLPTSNAPMLILGSQLYYHLPGSEPGGLRSVALLANGGVGRPNAVSDDPEEVPPRELNPTVVDGIQLGDRNVWVLTGYRSGEGGGAAARYLWVCCSPAREMSPLSRLFARGRSMMSLQVDRDSKGRIWLAWLDQLPRKAWGAVRMVELDPDTLAPRTPRAFTIQGPESWLRPKLACATECRLVMQDLGGDIFTWTPGERSPTRTQLGTRQDPATLLDASFRSGRLLVASARTLHFNHPPWNVEEVSILRGDSRGAHGGRVSTVAPVPFGPSSPFQWQPPIDATFTPDGLVFFKKYLNFRELSKTRVVVGFLVLGR